MFFATVRFTVAKNPDKCPNLRTVGNYMSNCRKKRTSHIDHVHENMSEKMWEEGGPLGGLTQPLLDCTLKCKEKKRT